MLEMRKVKTRYQQCKLVKYLADSEIHTVSYIPEKFAVVGRTVKLRRNGKWTDGWIVESACDVVDELPDARKIIRDHKRATGDSLPKEKKLRR